MSDVAIPDTADVQLVFETMATLERAQAFRPCALSLPEGTTIEQYEAVGVALGEVRRRVSWYIGDWLNFGEGAFGERFAQAINSTGLEQETLRAYAYVCGRIPEKRRKAKLMFGHHRLVAPLEPKQQDYWLGQAEKSGWTVTELRGAIEAENAKGQGQIDGTSGEPTSFRKLVCEVIVRIRDEAVEDVSGQAMTIRKELFHQLCAFVEED